MSAAYFKTIRSILKGCLTCPHRCQNSTLNPQVASFPSVWTSHTHFKCNCRLVQRSQEEVGRAVSSFKGSALPGAGKNAGSGGVGGHTPLFFGIRITMGTRDLTMSKQCPQTVVIKTQVSWRGKEQPRITEPLLTSALCWLVLSKDSISWVCASSHH